MLEQCKVLNTNVMPRPGSSALLEQKDASECVASAFCLLGGGGENGFRPIRMSPSFLGDKAKLRTRRPWGSPWSWPPPPTRSAVRVSAAMGGGVLKKYAPPLFGWTCHGNKPFLGGLLFEKHLYNIRGLCKAFWDAWKEHSTRKSAIMVIALSLSSSLSQWVESRKEVGPPRQT